MPNVTQILSTRYVDKTKLRELCINAFGAGNFQVEVVGLGVYELARAAMLT